MKLFGIDFAPLNIPLERRIQTIGAFHFSYVFLFLGFGSLFFMLYLLLCTQYYYLVLIYAVWYYSDRGITSHGGRPILWMMHWKFWKHFCDYFPMKLVKTSELDPEKNYILGYHPHGVLSVGAFANFATFGSGFDKLFPGIRPSLLVLAGHFQFPLYREYFMCTGATEATKESMTYMLTKHGKGNALALVPGGPLEALECIPGSTTLKMKSRKGFIKLAIRTGTCLVPMYSFGENDLFEQVKHERGRFLKELQIIITRFTGFSPPIFHGRGIFNYTFGLLPYRKPVNTVVGKPIEVTKKLEPTQKDIDEVHQQYLDDLNELFETHKTKYGVGEDVHLNITQ